MVQNEVGKAAHRKVSQAERGGEELNLLPGDHRGNTGGFWVVLLRGERPTERAGVGKRHRAGRPG